MCHLMALITKNRNNVQNGLQDKIEFLGIEKQVIKEEFSQGATKIKFFFP